MDCPHESLKANAECALEEFILLSEDAAYWAAQDAEESQ